MASTATKSEPVIVDLRRPFKRRRIILPLAASLFATAAWTRSEAVPPGVYEINTQTLMPHLEENLRYANTRERRCIHDQTASGFFPILRHHSLTGCNLATGHRSGDTTYYPLVCDSAQETTGFAELHIVANRIDGELQIQTGGKNMTFSQRIKATRRGDCDK